MSSTVEQKIIEECLNPKTLKSFKLLAPAGSGKTYAIKEVLSEFNSKYGIQYLQQRRQIAVITYTNIASDEILARVGQNQLFHISTIHSFIWDLIKYYPKYIKQVMLEYYQVKIEEDIQKIKNPKTRKIDSYKAELEKYKQKIQKIEEIKRFVYSPAGDNNKYNSLNHSEVIMIGREILTNEKYGRKGFSKVLISRFPILLIDECQDTNKGLMNSFLLLSDSMKGKFCLGILGDSMQRIYMDGLENINNVVFEKTYIKGINHRSPNRIVQLINKIRELSDGIEQESYDSAKEGFVHAFITNDTNDRILYESNVKKRMDILVDEGQWNNDDKIKILTLEHMMAAKRNNFFRFYEPLKSNESIKSNLQEGRCEEINYLIKLYDILIAFRDGEKSKLKKMVLNTIKLNEDIDACSQLKQFKSLKKNVESFSSQVHDFSTITCIEILRIANHTIDALTMPSSLNYLVNLSPEDYDSLTSEDEELEVDDSSLSPKKLLVWRDALNAHLLEAERCYHYMLQDSIYATHQGVKGAGFDNVMAILDDVGANGHLFSYEKLFGVKKLSETDIENRDKGEDNTYSRTLRLFYVLCSRAMKSLAVVIYTKDKQIVKDALINKFGFSENEIDVENN